MLLPALIAVSLAPIAGEWAQFSRTTSYSTQTVQIARVERFSPEQPLHELRLTTTSREGVTRTQSADTTKCPAALTVIASMRGLTMPSPAPPMMEDTGAPRLVPSDAAGYHLSVPSSLGLGRIELTSSIATPLARWVDRSLEKLGRCWRGA
jgi:hypothetical protein